MSFLSDMALEQSEIEVVFGALEEWCQKTNVKIDSPDGRDVATVMLGLYKTGHNSKPAILEAMLKVNGLEQV
ncbi:hypothetical protein QO002_000669 [Pararhizobium capsulatum DSM 1112]|uniref:Uncharacterized protein n=1 Tax=Pararhizobium capsulatum DSM 1112 TaxID=1121113 RepID=A0ABU0BLF1_9HYPH|nr:hypothetical protein [Pararhizobium capsulatum]MDQ0318531.1 hypothetical protein [Pararhizobium capsulatum DSM 1112]